MIQRIEVLGSDLPLLEHAAAQDITCLKRGGLAGAVPLWLLAETEGDRRTHFMRIAVVTPFPVNTEPARGGGIHLQTVEMAKWADVDVYVPHPKYPKLRLLHPKTFLYQRDGFAREVSGIAPQFVEYPAFPLASRPLNGWSLSRQLLPRFQMRVPDVVLSYCIYPDACGAALAAGRLNIPLIAGSLGSDLRRISDFLCRRMVRYTLKNADFVIGVSRDLVQRAEALGARSGRTRMIPAGCDTSLFFPEDKNAARRALGISLGAPVILFTGRLVPLKGLPELIEALVRLRSDYPELLLACAGDGPMRGQWEQLSRQKGVGDAVHFLGDVRPKEVAKWLAACDIFCLPSHSEGSPISIMEALACGRPVVASRVGGIPDLVDDRVGFLVPPKEPGQLAGALSSCLRKTWDANTILRDSASARRTLQDIAKETFALCEEVVRMRQRSRIGMSA